MEDGYDEGDLDAPMLDAEEGESGEGSKLPELEKLCFIGQGNNAKLARETLVGHGYQAMARGT